MVERDIDLENGGAGHRTAIFSNEWQVSFVSDEADADIRTLVAAAAFVWHYGRAEE